jgi:uncharacterized membrane protein YczE
MFNKWVQFGWKTISIILGSVLFAFGVVTMLNADMGMNTWAVLDCGITHYVNLSLGQVTQITGFLALGLGWFMGFPPGYATLISIVFMGNAINTIIQIGVVPTPTALTSKLALIVLSAVCFGAGTVFYVTPELGAGPRDSLMMGLIQRLRYPVAYIRIGLEFAVILVGYLLGGPVGVGTLLNSVLVGYTVDIAFRISGYDRDTKHMGLQELYTFLNTNR